MTVPLGMSIGIAVVFAVLFTFAPNGPDNWLDGGALFAAVIAGAFLGKAVQR